MPKPLANTLTLCGSLVTVLCYLATTIVILASCIPRASDDALGGWLSPANAARCNKIDGPFTAAVGIVGVILDYYILCVPLIFIWGLQISPKRKIGVSAVFLVGFV